MTAYILTKIFKTNYCKYCVGGVLVKGWSNLFCLNHTHAISKVVEQSLEKTKIQIVICETKMKIYVF